MAVQLCFHRIEREAQTESRTPCLRRTRSLSPRPHYLQLHHHFVALLHPLLLLLLPHQLLSPELAVVQVSAVAGHPSHVRAVAREHRAVVVRARPPATARRVARASTRRHSPHTRVSAASRAACRRTRLRAVSVVRIAGSTHVSGVKLHSYSGDGTFMCASSAASASAAVRSAIVAILRTGGCCPRAGGCRGATWSGRLCARDGIRTGGLAPLETDGWGGGAYEV